MTLNITDKEFLEYVSKTYKLKGNYIELGVRNGYFSQLILDHATPEYLYLVDKWEHLDDYNDSSNVSNQQHELKYQDVVKKFEDTPNVHIVRALTSEAVLEFDDNFFDFIYIDANHGYKYVKQDIEDWYPKLKSGGILAGDDYHPIWSGVIKAVDEFANKHSYGVDITEKNFIWFLEKR